MIFENNDRIMFTGDSVTAMGRCQGKYGEGLGDNVGKSYVRIIENLTAACYPEIKLRIMNAAVGGYTSRDMLIDWKIVLEEKPEWVSLMIGVNDVWRQFDTPAIPHDQISPEQYRKNVEKMISSVRNDVKGFILMTPYYMEPLKEDPMRKRIDEYVAICKELAEKYDCILVDTQAMFDNYFKHRHSSFIAYDRVHPNQIGHTLIAMEFLKNCGFDYEHTV